jgi:hypothetical protein
VPDAAFRRPVATSRGFATLRGLGTAGPGRVWVSARPPAVRHRPGWSSYGPRRLQPKPHSGPPCAYVPLQRSNPCSPAPRCRLADPKIGKTTRSRDAASLGVSCPTTHSRTGGSALMAADPSTAACHVRGLATSFAASTTGPTGARSAGASMGFALQGVPLGASGAPLGALALLTLPSTPLPEGSGIGRPPTGPRSRDESVLPPGSRRIPAVDAFLGLSPPERSLHPPGRSLVVTMPALSSLGGMTSLPTWTSGLLGSDGSAWSISGLPALLGFRTLRPSRRSVHRPGERAHGFTSRRTPRACATPTAI